ncbi:hypothetical protein FOZ63_005115 [Perkinsus olseni]|uniref:Uncharacterized protein n=1 Tax=Perkinsus olseni TaxID=32597 RepID=A0A7J6UE42_PEROL|nr:hypothetical protein FOZ62_026370 [Perkinsus olseni]KAF4755393.1 hypothetical protein FOZ63_005115 [Perkinsus olseni]
MEQTSRMDRGLWTSSRKRPTRSTKKTKEEDGSEPTSSFALASVGMASAPGRLVMKDLFKSASTCYMEYKPQDIPFEVLVLKMHPPAGEGGSSFRLSVRVTGSSSPMAEYISYGDGTWEFRFDEGDEKLHWSKGEERSVHEKMGKMNPFYLLLSNIRSEFNMEDPPCDKIADYIEQNPMPGYEPGPKWLGRFMIDEAVPEYHLSPDRVNTSVNIWLVPERLLETREVRSSGGVLSVPERPLHSEWDYLSSGDSTQLMGHVRYDIIDAERVMMALLEEAHKIKASRDNPRTMTKALAAPSSRNRLPISINKAQVSNLEKQLDGNV